MLIHCDGNMARDGAMHAAHTALESYFLLCKYCPSEAATWFHFQHRAYLETIVIALWLKSRRGDDGYDDNDDVEQMCASENNGAANGRNRGHDSNNKTNNRELLTLQAREDVSKMYTMLKAKASGSGSGSGSGSNNEENGDEDLVARTRARNLEECGEELWGSV